MFIFCQVKFRLFCSRQHPIFARPFGRAKYFWLKNAIQIDELDSKIPKCMPLSGYDRRKFFNFA